MIKSRLIKPQGWMWFKLHKYIEMDLERIPQKLMSAKRS